MSDKFDFYIYDLDNTIINEQIYLYQAYYNIASYVGEKYQINISELDTYLQTEFSRVGRTELFDKFLRHYSIPNEEMVEILHRLRNAKLTPKLEINDRLIPYFDKSFRNNDTIPILTNGNINQQKNKINNTNWRHFDGKLDVFFAIGDKKKPSPAGIVFFKAKYGFQNDRCALIGDSLVDEECAGCGGIHFISIDEITHG